MPDTRKRICPICEAGCGLVVAIEGRSVLSARGNPDDTFSGGHVCPKGVALPELDADPDRLRTPLIRRAGRLEPASWDDAMAVVAERLALVRSQHGNDAVAIYLGNPSAHNIGLGTGFGVLARALATRNIYTAGSVDQLPKQLANALLFGNDMAVAVPDIERCDLLLMLGANPIVSNGSLWMVPDIRGKLQALRNRGGALVVADPRRTETARLADQHLPIRPGTDAWLLAALINAVHAAGRAPSPRLAARLRGHDALLAALSTVSVEQAAERTGIAAAEIRALAERLAAAANPVVYGRVGTTLQRFGTLTSFLIDALNIQLDALDRPGGAMFPEQPFATPGHRPGVLPYARYHSRVSGYPELLGQMPAACLAEEMETAGPGQIRALVTIAGNPVISNPDSARLERAIAGLDFRVAIDIYLNETTRLADVVLPGTSPFEEGHYDSFLGGMTWRNTARYSPPLFPLQDRPDEWRLMLGIACAAGLGRAPTGQELDDFEDEVVAQAVRGYVSDESGPLAGRDVQEILAAIGPQRGVERLLDLGIRAGRWGDAFGARPAGTASDPHGLTLQRMIDSPDSIDLGPLQPSLDRVVRSADGRLDLAPSLMLDEIARLRSDQTPADPAELLLIGRRNIQTNNSWLHNLPRLAKGPARCVLEMHPADAAARGLGEGELVAVRTRVDQVVVPLHITDELAPGVVCLPHGFSHAGTPEQRLAQQRGLGNHSANSNRLAAAGDVDRPSATAALNGIPVVCERALAVRDSV
jgi:anaerobic selenocysteine-containing dehydrogenase